MKRVKLSTIAAAAVAILCIGAAVAAQGQESRPQRRGRPDAGHGEFSRIDFKHMKSRQILDNIFSRKSVRRFTGEVVPQDTLTLLVKAGMAAPTGKNKQPWEFLAVNDSAKIALLAEKLGSFNGPIVKSAGAVIVVCGRPDVSHNWMLDCAAATENILLAAESMDLGAVWTASWPYEERMAATVSALGIPEGVVPLSVIPVGHPQGEQRIIDKWKPEKFHFNEW